MNVAPRGEIHDGVSTPADSPDRLLDFFLDRGGDGRVANVGIDLDEEVASDDHRLALRVVDVVGEDSSSSSDLVTNELRGDALRNISSKALAWMLRVLLSDLVHELILTDSDILHLGGDDPLTSIV